MKSYINSEAIFGLYRVNLHNRILISTWLGDLKFSASSTARPKLQRPWNRPFMVRFGWNFLCELRVTHHIKYVCPRTIRQHLENSAHPTLHAWKIACFDFIDAYTIHIPHTKYLILDLHEYLMFLRQIQRQHPHSLMHNTWVRTT